MNVIYERSIPMPLDDLDRRNIADTPDTAWKVRDELMEAAAYVDQKMIPLAEKADQLGLDMSIVDLEDLRGMLNRAADDLTTALREDD